MLGLVPMALGLRGLLLAIRAHGADEPPAPSVATGFASVVAVTVANGADNVAVYTPMFRSISTGASVITIAVFGVLIGVWCALGSWLGSHRPVIDALRRYGHWIVPIVFAGIGAIIVLGSGVLQKL